MLSKKMRVLSFTARGEAVLVRLEEALSETTLLRRGEGVAAKDWVEKAFSTQTPLVVIGAVGIAVRLVAPFLQGKERDPAVVVVDEGGQYAISLLSGHLGGANTLCTVIAKALDCTPIITTATDLAGVFAVDSWAVEQNCCLLNVEQIKRVSATLLQGKAIGFVSDFPQVGACPFAVKPKAEVGISLSLDGKKVPFAKTLQLIPRIVTIGVGCKRATDPAALELFLLCQLGDAGISIQAVEQVASIDLKQYETAIVDFCVKYGLPFITASAEALKGVAGTFSASPFVEQVTGVDNVCERSAVYASGGRVLVKKVAKDGMTMSIAIKEWKCQF